MVDEHVLNVVQQLTLRKLEYIRQLLKSVGMPYSGSRPKLRERLVEAIENNRVTVSHLQTLLDELDTWGDQRIRVGRLPTDSLTEFQSLKTLSRRTAEVGMAHLLDGAMALIPPLDLTPMKISYDEYAGRKQLRLVAAKTRHIMQPQPEIADYVDEKYPDVVFKPFKVEAQKVLAFAEIDLITGLTFISTTLLRQGQGYTAEFGEFFTVFKLLIAFQEIDIVPFYKATRHILHQLSANEVRLIARRARTSVGGKIDFRSHSRRVDMRSDPELNRSQEVLPDAPGLHCNCYWEPVNGLDERVHTHIFAPEGEISVFGKVREESARYVLQRILKIN